MEADVSRVRGDQSCSIPPLHSSCVVISLLFWQEWSMVQRTLVELGSCEF
jgi:hypothetical protein